MKNQKVWPIQFNSKKKIFGIEAIKDNFFWGLLFLYLLTIIQTNNKIKIEHENLCSPPPGIIPHGELGGEVMVKIE